MRALFWIWAFAGTAAAAPPTLDAVFPAGGQAGSEFEVTVQGKHEPWPCEVWCSAGGVVFAPDAEKAGKYKVKIAGDAKAGAYLVRLFNKEGGSAPRTFVVGAAAEITEAEGGNNDLSKPQVIDASPPMVVNGCLAKGGQVDFYQFEMRAGARLPIWLDGHSLQSPIDPHLHIYDSRGTRLTVANDRTGGLDPEIEFEAPADGAYTVAVMAFAHPPSSSVSFTGSSKAVYRLALGGGRIVPANTVQLPGRLELPFEISGEVAGTQKSARYLFEAKKGQKLWLEARGRVGSPLDAVLRVEKEDGELIKEIDDTKTSADPEYLWSVPADGVYAAVVSDRFGRSGEAFRFALSVAEATPDFSASVTKTEFVVKRGESVDVELNVTRLHGHAGKLAVEVEGLPAGVEMEVPDIPEKGGSVKLKWIAAKEAEASSGEVRITVVEAEAEGRSRPALFPFKKDAPYGAYLIEDTDALWLTVVE